MMTDNRFKFIADIEILRALAIILVFFHHFQEILQTLRVPYTNPIYEYFGGGRGVDLFFVISGFVIARGLLPQLHRTSSAQTFFQLKR